MIIIKIIFQYLIQIGHTDDFPSTGTRLVCITRDVLGSPATRRHSIPYIPCNGNHKGTHTSGISKGIRNQSDLFTHHWLESFLSGLEPQ